MKLSDVIIDCRDPEVLPRGKNRVHFDIRSQDPAAEPERLEALGASYLPQYAGGGFLVMADPEGNEFCVLPEGPFELDDEGRADYLPRAL